MSAQKPSRFVAFITLAFFVSSVIAVAWFAYNLTSSHSSYTEGPTPTPTPEPGTYNIDEQLDMLSQ